MIVVFVIVCLFGFLYTRFQYSFKQVTSSCKLQRCYNIEQELEKWRFKLECRIQDAVQLTQRYIENQSSFMLEFNQRWLLFLSRLVIQSICEVDKRYAQYENAHEIKLFIYPRMYTIVDEFVTKMKEELECFIYRPIANIMSAEEEEAQKRIASWRHILFIQYYYTMLMQLSNAVGSCAANDNTRRDTVAYYLLEYARELTRFKALSASCYNGIVLNMLSYYPLFKTNPVFNWVVDFDALAAALEEIRALPDDADENTLIQAIYPWTSTFGSLFVRALEQNQYLPLGTVERLALPERLCA